MILVLGHKGNMGSRYGAILDRLGIDWVGSDYDDVMPEKFDASIVATPTESHIWILKKLLAYKKPVLCEKPISKINTYVKMIVDDYKHHGVPLAMVNQYRFMHGIKLNVFDSHTIYNYYKSGGDGLVWDCINLIGLAENTISLKNESPIWECVLNGRQLKIQNMDTAYVDMISHWVGTFHDDYDYILKSHERAYERAKKIAPNIDRHTSQIN